MLYNAGNEYIFLLIEFSNNCHIHLNTYINIEKNNKYSTAEFTAIMWKPSGSKNA